MEPKIYDDIPSGGSNNTIYAGADVIYKIEDGDITLPIFILTCGKKAPKAPTNYLAAIIYWQ